MRTQVLRKVVLVVEDDRAVGELIASAINEETSYHAIHVLSPAQALETLAQVTPDVIVVDVRLPGMSGFELYDRLKQDPRTKLIPLLFETAGDAETMAAFRLRGIAAYVRKPFELSELVSYVKRLATGGLPGKSGNGNGAGRAASGRVPGVATSGSPRFAALPRTSSESSRGAR